MIRRLVDIGGARPAEPLPPRWVRLAAYPLLFPLGAAVSVAGSFVQSLWVPGGLLLALAGTIGVFYGGLRLTGTKLGAGVPLVGWFAMLLVLMAPRPEGSFVLAADPASYSYLFVGAVGGVVCATLPTRGAFGPTAGRPAGDGERAVRRPGP